MRASFFWQAMAQDDPEYRALLDKENTVPATPQSGGGAPVKAEDYTDDRLVDEGVTVGFGNGRWDKSLGVLCQKFVMLFLVTPVSNEIHTQAQQTYV